MYPALSADRFDNGCDLPERRALQDRPRISLAMVCNCMNEVPS